MKTLVLGRKEEDSSEQDLGIQHSDQRTISTTMEVIFNEMKYWRKGVKLLSMSGRPQEKGLNKDLRRQKCFKENSKHSSPEAG